MSDKKLELIQINKNSGGLGIMSNGMYPFIVQYNSDGSYNKINTGEYTEIDPITSEEKRYIDPNRPLDCSEISHKLKNKLWLNGNLTVWDTNTETFKLLDPFKYSGFSFGKDYNSVINIDMTSKAVEDSPSRTITIGETSEEIINQYYEECFPEGTFEEVTYNKNTKTETALLDGNTKTYELIKQNSDSYQNTIDLNYLFNLSKNENTVAYITVGLAYTKEQGIYSITKSFDLFRYRKQEDKIVLVNEDFIFKVNSDITLEYIGGVLRMFPENDEIIEYIIESCTVEYGE